MDEMKKKAREVLADRFTDWCDAFKLDDEKLITVNQAHFCGLVDLYEELFDEFVYYNVDDMRLRYENRDGEEV